MTFAAVARFLHRRPPTVAPRAAYALWARSYPPAPHNALMRAEQSVMAPMIASAAPKRALDVGTGTGRYLPVLAAAGARTIVGADLSFDMLIRHEAGWPRLCADARRLPFRDAAFDLVSSSLMLGDIEEPSSWVAEAARLLVPGGHLVYSDFHPSWAAERWERTFTAPDGRVVRVPYHPHAIAAHLDALETHGFDVRAIREPRLLEPDATSRARGLPVVVAFHGVRRGWRRPATKPPVSRCDGPVEARPR